MISDELKLSKFQRRVLAVPEDVDLFLGGGRGGGKSFTIALLALRFAEAHGAAARMLYVRRTHRAVEDFAATCRELFGAAYGRAFRYNSAEGTFRLPGGAYLEVNQLHDPSDYLKVQGRSFAFVAVDEATQYAEPTWVDRLRSNLRAPRGVPTRFVMAANPGEVGHHWCANRYVFACDRPWKPFVEKESGRTFVYAPSVFTDNDHLDHASYRAQLEASCATDPELLRAWVEGDWSISRGAYFAGVLSEDRVATDAWDPAAFVAARDPSAREGRRVVPIRMNGARPTGPPDRGETWDLYLAHDYGIRAPSVTYVVARSPGAEGPDGRWYPRDSLVLIDELATNQPGSLDEGLGWTIPQLAEAITDLARRWGMERPAGVADDACFARTGHGGAATIAAEFAERGVDFEPARKGDRRTGWEKLRLLLAAAGEPDRPGLYVSRACSYFWQSTPYLPRDPRRPDDVDTRGPDHAADCARYAVMAERGARICATRLAGWW